MYEGNDRVQQVNALRTLASDVVTNSGIESPAEACVAVAEYVDDEPMPSWYDDHDRDLLLTWIAAEALSDRIYQQPTGYVYFVELEPATPLSDPTGIEIVVLTPEEEIACRLSTHSQDGGWELTTVEGAADYILNAQQEVYDRRS